MLKLKRKWHIKSRIFCMLILLMLLVFSGVFFAFNIFIQSYIRSNVESQLHGITSEYDMRDNKPDNPPNTNNNLPDISRAPKSKIGAENGVFTISSDYALKNYNENEDIKELSLIAAYMKNKGITADGARYVFVRTEQQEYYVSTEADTRSTDFYLVFYVNVTAVNSLVTAINIALAVIVAVAMLICLWISNIIAGSIINPVKKLSKFAEEIGKGNFKKREFSFSDMEFYNLAEVMNRTAEKLDLYDKDQRTFFQNVSHELRTPLMSIRCYAEGAECGLMDVKKAGATIISETDRLSGLVEDLLYISRVDSISDKIEKSENDLRDTLSLCASSLQAVADKNNISFIFEFDENPVLFIYNEKHMYRAFMNLISNALRYAEKTITLRCRQDEKYITISVADDGEGIPEEDIPHLFERFYKGKGGKHGIGLSIVKSAAELHGGTVSLDPGGEETCFSIKFEKLNEGVE